MCDGIFLNYNWSEDGLKQSRALASNRFGDVYVGIDVFGRGCYGGGGYNSVKVGIRCFYMCMYMYICFTNTNVNSVYVHTVTCRH